MAGVGVGSCPQRNLKLIILSLWGRARSPQRAPCSSYEHHANMHGKGRRLDSHRHHAAQCACRVAVGRT